jgi:beta-N-acetylhexosaminidase
LARRSGEARREGRQDGGEAPPHPGAAAERQQQPIGRAGRLDAGREAHPGGLAGLPQLPPDRRQRAIADPGAAAEQARALDRLDSGLGRTLQSKRAPHSHPAAVASALRALQLEHLDEAIVELPVGLEIGEEGEDLLAPGGHQALGGDLGRARRHRQVSLAGRSPRSRLPDPLAVSLPAVGGSTARRHPESVYRRRRIAALGLLAALALTAVLGIQALPGDDAQVEHQAEPSIPVAKLIGQRIVVRMEDTATPEMVEAAHDGSIGGVIVFPSPGIAPADLRAEIAHLQEAAREGDNPPLLVATDQEGGVVKRLPEGPPAQAAPELGAAGPDAARQAGAETARYLRELEINADLAPVLDVAAPEGSVMSARAFGTDPKAVAETGVAFAEGLADGGVAATAKHFPGLGRTSVNTDLESASIDASESELRRDLEPFEVAAKSGIAMVMLSNATYPALDPRAPATWSEPIIGDLLRGRLGYEGVVITDDLGAGAVTADRPPDEAGVAAARAGADLLLFATEPSSGRAGRELLNAARRGTLPRNGLEESYARIVSLKEGL